MVRKNSVVDGCIWSSSLRKDAPDTALAENSYNVSHTGISITRRMGTSLVGDSSSFERCDISKPRRNTEASFVFRYRWRVSNGYHMSESSSGEEEFVIGSRMLSGGEYSILRGFENDCPQLDSILPVGGERIDAGVLS